MSFLVFLNVYCKKCTWKEATCRFRVKTYYWGSLESWYCHQMEVYTLLYLKLKRKSAYLLHLNNRMLLGSVSFLFFSAQVVVVAVLQCWSTKECKSRKELCMWVRFSFQCKISFFFPAVCSQQAPVYPWVFLSIIACVHTNWDCEKKKLIELWSLIPVYFIYLPAVVWGKGNRTKPSLQHTNLQDTRILLNWISEC